MTPLAVLAELRQRGYQVSEVDGQVRVIGAQPLDDSLRSAVLSERVAILEALRGNGTPWQDPRPDLEDDARLWSRLVPLAWDRDGHDRCGVYGSLLGMRCLGVRLARGRRTLRLEPRPEPPGSPPAWVTPEQYRAERRRWLDPHREAVIALLAAASLAMPLGSA